MHVPDGLMDPIVAAVGWAEFLIVAAVAVLLSRKRVQEKDLPRIAVLSAGIFVAQMLNFPIGGGTTGHLIGGALFAIVAGPIVAIIGMTVILLIQALMFGDGGITAFGLNALNMAIIAPLTGWGVYNLLRPLTSRSRGADRAEAFDAGSGLAVAAASWASVFVAAAACAAELSLSYALSPGVYGIVSTIAVPAMLGYHALIGIGEAAITVGVVAYLWRVAPGVLVRPLPVSVPSGKLAAAFRSRTLQGAAAIIVVFALALPLYFLYASEGSDGLEKTMEDAGVGEGEPLVTAPLGYGESYMAALMAGIIGFLVVALVSLGLLRMLRGRGALD